MEKQLVFQEISEIKRLQMQNNLLSSYEMPVLEKIIDGKDNLSVLDIGCNVGSKTVKLFSLDSISCVIGVEYNKDLAIIAREEYGKGKFSFYHCDVESDVFLRMIHSVMEEKHIDGFDIIYLSLVLMHLSDVKKLLVKLHDILKPDGKLFIIESNDSASSLSGDENGLLDTFLQILKKDKYSGNRDVGENINEILSACGYENICNWYDAICAMQGEVEKKNSIFITFFTYLIEDVLLLLEAEPENEEYKEWAQWLEQNYDKLRNLILQDDSVVSMGVRILTCSKGTK